MRPLVPLAAALLLAAGTPGHAAPPRPQVIDPAGDANLSGNATYDASAPAGNQPYADVLSVLWRTTKRTAKVGPSTVTTVTGFTVTMTLSGAPTPPAGTAVVYRALATPPCGGRFFGVVYYSEPDAHGKLPRSAIRDDCTGETRLTPIAPPVVSGHTITWTVPLTAVPKDTRVRAGTRLTALVFETREIESLPPGACLPAGVPAYGGDCAFAFGLLDNGAPSEASYTIR